QPPAKKKTYVQMAPTSSQSTEQTFNLLLMPFNLLNGVFTSDSIKTSSARVTNQERRHLTHQKQCTITPNVYRKKKKRLTYSSHNLMEKLGASSQKTI
nr:hypothetical protein [Tanacetum cinerariifolium]